MMQSSVTTLASLLERTFPAGLSGLIFDCDGVMVDSRDVNIGYYNLLRGKSANLRLRRNRPDMCRCPRRRRLLSIFFRRRS